MIAPNNFSKLIALSLFLFCSFFLNKEFLNAQNTTPFALEFSAGPNYSDFTFPSNIYDALWDHRGVNTGSSIDRFIRGGFGWQVGIGVNKALNNQFRLRTKVSLAKGNFSHRIEGLVFTSNLYNPSAKLNLRSTLIDDFQFHLLEIPLEVDFFWSDKASSFYNTLGFGGAKLLKSEEQHATYYIDQSIVEKPNYVDSYRGKNWKSFIVLGIGKRISLPNSKSQISLGLYYKRYLGIERIEIFDVVGRLSNFNFLVTYQPW